MDDVGTTFDILIGRKLRYLRLLNGLTQKQLGSMLGVSFQQIQKYEHGRNHLSFERAVKVSRLFGIALDDWPYPENTNTGVMSADGNAHRQRTAIGLVNDFLAISCEHDRTLLRQLARSLAEKRPQ